MFSYDKRFNDIETLELQEGLARAFNTTIYCLAWQRSEPQAISRENDRQVHMNPAYEEGKLPIDR